MVFGLSKHTYEERLAELGMTTLEERRHQLDMAQVFKIITGHDKVEKSQWFTMAADSNVITRQATGRRNLIKPRINLEIQTNFFSARVVDGWNAVPTEIKWPEIPTSSRSSTRPTGAARRGVREPRSRSK
jgi:hypothetical protein